MVKPILDNTGDSANILFKNTFLHMDILWSQATPYVAPLVGFVGQTIQPERKISFRVNVENTAYMVEFLIVSSPSPYNCILGWPALNQLPAKVATYDLSIEVSDGRVTFISYTEIKKKLKSVISPQ